MNALQSFQLILTFLYVLWFYAQRDAQLREFMWWMCREVKHTTERADCIESENTSSVAKLLWVETRVFLVRKVVGRSRNENERTGVAQKLEAPGSVAEAVEGAEGIEDRGKWESRGRETRGEKKRDRDEDREKQRERRSRRPGGSRSSGEDVAQLVRPIHIPR